VSSTVPDPGEPGIDLQVISQVPKVLLHDHLDGGLRSATILDIAAQVGHELPAETPETLAAWFHNAAGSGSLERYLTTFEHTVAVMQRREDLVRVARECALDLAADAGTPIRIGTLLTAMRHAARSREIAELTVRHRDHGVVGFDIAGAEAGYPPSRHLDAFEYLHRENVHVTIHAGEAFGLPSIWEAVQVCGTDRLGHGVRIMDDVELLGGRDRYGRPRARLGRLAAWVRDRRIPLELCPTSNLMTGAATSVLDHPVTMLKDLRFRVTVNTDNRLMSATSMTREFALLTEEAGWTLADLRWVTINALKSAFIPFDERLALIDDVVKPGYAAAGAT
jgi:adenosine deaminase